MSSAADIVVVDRVGILGDVYAIASMAYVGGGFHGAGLHSVIEPAAFGVPVIFGPRHEMSRDARLLLENGGAMAIGDERTLVTTVSRWLKDAGRRGEAGATARQLVKDGLGAADRTFALVAALIE
jgi:3-deoxy-D-manno-octulosonic-acid transferase